MTIKTLESEQREGLCGYCGGDLIPSDLSFEPDHVTPLEDASVCTNCGAVFYESELSTPDIGVDSFPSNSVGGASHSDETIHQNKDCDMSINDSDFWRKLGNSEVIIEMASTPARLYILIAQLQLALRHPENTGASAEISRDIVLNMIDAVCAHIPEARASLEQGWHPAYDVSQLYFDSEFN